MSGDQLAISFTDPNPRPPTSQQTPTSAVFPSPIFETPKPGQGSVTDAGGWTPRFAEDYSVFNKTPGNLRGNQVPFVDLSPATPASRHKRLLSAETFAAEIATHVNHFFSNPNLPLPPVDPSRRLASSPNSVTVPQEYIADSTPLPSPDPSKQRKSSKKARKADLSGAEPTQTATPPPTGRRGERKLTDKLTMQNDQSFGQPDFTGASQQQHDIAALMAASGDMFGYPMATPGTAGFWDPSMGMDFDFNASPSNVFQTTPVQGHRHTGSFDWNNDIPLFQDPAASFASNPEPIQSARRDRTIAPKPLGPTAATTAASAAMSAALSAPIDDPFGMSQQANGVNPGLLFGSTHNPMLDSAALIPVTQAGSAEATIFQSRSRTPLGEDLRRSASVKELRATKAPDRALAPSPVKSNSRPGMGRSVSENRGKRNQPQTQNRPVLPKLAPAVRPVSQASNGSNSDNGRPIARPTGRLSPMKSQHRLSSLASIPEAPLQPPRTRTSVRFTIDSRGRARAETTVVHNECDWDGSFSHRRTSRDRSRTGELGFSDDEDSSSDDEPIIIPSRTNSFNASFALPDPLKPVGSIFHSSRRSVSDRSTSSIGAHDGMGGSQHDGESETETFMHERREKVGDATSELRKVMEDRKKRSNQMGGAGQHRYLQTNNLGPFRGDTISPSTLTDSSLVTDRQDIRCVCSRKGADGVDGFMIQCESCEMWLHGKCINMNSRTRPRVYICAFCANTPNMRGGRRRDTGRGSMLGVGAVPSPLANKSFRAFR